MYSWEVVCITVPGEDDPEDCSSIEEIGYLAPLLRQKSMDTAHIMMENNTSHWHVMFEGERYDLIPAVQDGVRYLRALDEDSPSDPLLQLPLVENYQSKESMRKRFG